MKELPVTLRAVFLHKMRGIFFIVEMLVIAVYMTNQKIAEIKAQLPETILSDNRCCYLYPNNSAEFLAFIGLVIYAVYSAKQNITLTFCFIVLLEAQYLELQ